MKKLVLITLLIMSALSGAAWSRDHIYCSEKYEPQIGKCHINHGHPNGH